MDSYFDSVSLRTTLHVLNESIHRRRTRLRKFLGRTGTFMTTSRDLLVTFHFHFSETPNFVMEINTPGQSCFTWVHVSKCIRNGIGISTFIIEVKSLLFRLRILIFNYFSFFIHCPNSIFKGSDFRKSLLRYLLRSQRTFTLVKNKLTRTVSFIKSPGKITILIKYRSLTVLVLLELDQFRVY